MTSLCTVYLGLQKLKISGFVVSVVQVFLTSKQSNNNDNYPNTLPVIESGPV